MMGGADFDDVTVVIRSVGERTAEACRLSVLEQGVPEAQIFVVREAPFSKALRRSFEIGVADGRAWTMCLDADVVLRRGAIAALVRRARPQPAEVCEIQGLALDKFLLAARPVGSRFYRSAVLGRMIVEIPPEGTDIRPESYTLNRMKLQGFRWFNVPVLLGVHDFEQTFRDIFRKAFVQAQKHAHLLPEAAPAWRRLAANDPDFQVALKGLYHGLADVGEARIDINYRPFIEHFEALGLAEKPPLALDGSAVAFAERTIAGILASDTPTVQVFPFTMADLIEREPDLPADRGAMFRHAFLRRRREHGLLRAAAHALGERLEAAGAFLRRRAIPQRDAA